MGDEKRDPKNGKREGGREELVERVKKKTSMSGKLGCGARIKKSKGAEDTGVVMGSKGGGA